MGRKGQIQDMFGSQSPTEPSKVHEHTVSRLWGSELLTAKYLLCAGHRSKHFTCTVLMPTID